MSFKDLQKSRQEKHSSSYVKSTKDQQNTSQSSPTQEQPLSVTPTETPPTEPEWLYKALPSFLDIRSSPISGRGLWANSPLERGSVLISTRPKIASLSTRYLASHCSSCFSDTSVSKLQRCTICRVVRYCDSACQSKDWSLHKLECVALQRWAKSAPSEEHSIPSDAVRCLGRLVWSIQKQGPQGVLSREVARMQSHRASLQPSQYESHTQFAHFLVHYLGASAPEELAAFGLSTSTELVDLISRFITNTFAITSPSLVPLGASISPVVALINHSCDPNAVVVFPRSSSSSKDEPLMQVIAIKPIAPNEEVFTAYIDTTFPRAIRQQSLSETYSFTCHCTLCSNPAALDPRESMLCPKDCGGTCPLPTEENSLTRCVKCKAAVQATDEVLDAVRIGQEALDKATALEVKDASKATQLTSKLIPILTSAKLAPGSHPLLALTRLYQSLLLASLPDPLTQEALDDAIRISKRSVTGLLDVLTEGHPVRALALVELGKLLAVDEPQPKTNMSAAEAALLFPPSGEARLKMACNVLLKARTELLIGFGKKNEGGQVGMQVRESIAGLEKELAVWKSGVRNALQDRPPSIQSAR